MVDCKESGGHLGITSINALYDFMVGGGWGERGGAQSFLNFEPNAKHELMDTTIWKMRAERFELPTF